MIDIINKDHSENFIAPEDEYILEEIAYGHMSLYDTYQYRGLCLEAVKMDGLLLEDVKEQDIGICLAAIKQNPNAIKYVDKKYLYQCEPFAKMYELLNKGK